MFVNVKQYIIILHHKANYSISNKNWSFLVMLFWINNSWTLSSIYPNVRKPPLTIFNFVYSYKLPPTFKLMKWKIIPILYLGKHNNHEIHFSCFFFPKSIHMLVRSLCCVTCISNSAFELDNLFYKDGVNLIPLNIKPTHTSLISYR